MTYPYANVDDVLTRYKPLSTMLGVNTLDITTVDISSVFIKDAQAYMDAFLSVRYVTPVSVEPLITQLCADIAIYKILEDKAPRIPDFMEKRFSNAQSMLLMLGAAAVNLTGSNVVVSSTGNQEVWSNVLENQGSPIFQPVEAFSHFNPNSGCW